MKALKRYLPLLFVSMLTLSASLSSCTADTLADAPDEIPADESEGVLYFSMRVKTAAAEALDDAAPDYVDGSGFEHAVDFSGASQNVVVFFDGDGNYKGYSSLEFDRLSAQGTPAPGVADESAFIGFLRPDYHEAYVMPDYGMMVLNAHDIIPALRELSYLPSPTIRDVLGVTDRSAGSHIAGRSGNYFTMSSVAYLSKETDEWKHSMLFKIDREKVFSTRTQALISPAATAYVERLASKFSLKISGAPYPDLRFRPDGGRAQVIVCNYIDGEPNYNNRNWTCTVTGWGINKYEPTEYFFKNILTDGADLSTYPFSFGTDVNQYGHPFFPGWNRQTDRRCFWAVDPNYYSGVFPVQCRPAVDNVSLEYLGMKGEPSLAYISYNELSTDFTHLAENADGPTLYSTENTFPDTRLGGLWQHDLASSQLVIGARIHISGVSEDGEDYDLFRNRIGVFFPSAKDFATYFITTFNNQLNSHSTMSYRYYNWDEPADNEDATTHTQSIPFDDYKLYYKGQPLTPEVMASLPAFAMAATVENGDGKVIPWVEGMYIGRRAKDPNTYEEVGDVMRLSISANDFKSLIYDWVGAFDHFNKGRMVYSVPVLYRASESTVSASGYRPKIGDFGVVRNTWYKFDLKAVNSLGNPVDNPDQKIIPYESSLENSIMMEIKVLDWHEFSTTVTLPGAQ